MTTEIADAKKRKRKGEENAQSFLFSKFWQATAENKPKYLLYLII